MKMCEEIQAETGTIDRQLQRLEPERQRNKGRRQGWEI